MKLEIKKFDKEILKNIKKLYVYDNWHGLMALTYDYFVIVIAIVLCEMSYYFFAITLLLIGSRQRALATVLHEASHSSLTKNKKFGKILGTYFSGYLIFQSWDSYYKSHVKYHHPQLGQDTDPDFQYYKESGVYNACSKKRFYWNYFWSYMLCLHSFYSLKYLIQNRLLSAPNKKEVMLIIFSQMILFIILTYLTNIYGYILYWLLPYLTTFQIFTWFIELSEHYPMVSQYNRNLECSRNRFSNPLEHFFTAIHAENFHLIHHLFPAIPYWQLAAAHKILMQDNDYAKVNQNFGGIFFSYKNRPAMWKDLWEKVHNA